MQRHVEALGGPRRPSYKYRYALKDAVNGKQRLATKARSTRSCKERKRAKPRRLETQKVLAAGRERKRGRGRKKERKEGRKKGTGKKTHRVDATRENEPKMSIATERRDTGTQRGRERETDTMGKYETGTEDDTSEKSSGRVHHAQCEGGKESATRA